MRCSRARAGAMAGFLLIFFLIGAWQMASGAWIYIKAHVAQFLLQRAWSGALAGQEYAKPWPWADTWPMARLRVLSENTDLIVLNGAYGRTLAFGPGFLESSAFPGSIGTTILTGHRDTHFRFLQRLKRGDEILLTTRNQQRHRFRVSSTTIVDAGTASIHQDTQENHLALVTCYPFEVISSGGPLRYVVMAEKVEETLYATSLRYAEERGTRP